MIPIRVIIPFILCLPLTISGQAYINLSKRQVRRELEKQVAANDTIKILLTETYTSIHYSVRDKKLLPADFIYIFDEKGKCSKEIVIASCDSCFTKYLQKALDRKNIGWQKLNARAYISAFVKKRMLEIPANNIPHSYIIRKMKWNRQAYGTLLHSK